MTSTTDNRVHIWIDLLNQVVFSEGRWLRLRRRLRANRSPKKTRAQTVAKLASVAKLRSLNEEVSEY